MIILLIINAQVVEIKSFKIREIEIMNIKVPFNGSVCGLSKHNNINILFECIKRKFI